MVYGNYSVAQLFCSYFVLKDPRMVCNNVAGVKRTFIPAF